MIEIIVIILLTMMVVGLIIYSLKNKTNLIQIQKKNSLLEDKIIDLCSENEKAHQIIKNTYDKLDEITRDKEAALTRLVSVVNEKQEVVENTSREISKLNEQITTMRADEAVFSAKENYNVELEQELKRLEEQIKLRSSELELISTNAASIAVDEKKKLRRLEELEALIKASERRIESSKYALKDIELRYKTMEDKLDDLTILHRSVLALEEGPGAS